MSLSTWWFVRNFKNTVGRAEYQFHSFCSIESHMSYWHWSVVSPNRPLAASPAKWLVVEQTCLLCGLPCTSVWDVSFAIGFQGFVIFDENCKMHLKLCRFLQCTDQRKSLTKECGLVLLFKWEVFYWCTAVQSSLTQPFSLSYLCSFMWGKSTQASTENCNNFLLCLNHALLTSLLIKRKVAVEI